MIDFQPPSNPYFWYFRKLYQNLLIFVVGLDIFSKMQFRKNESVVIMFSWQLCTVVGKNTWVGQKNVIYNAIYFHICCSLYCSLIYYVNKREASCYIHVHLMQTCDDAYFFFLMYHQAAINTTTTSLNFIYLYSGEQRFKWIGFEYTDNSGE